MIDENSFIICNEKEAKETIESFNLKKIESNSFLALDIYEGDISGEAVALGVLGYDERFGVSSIGTAGGLCCCS